MGAEGLLATTLPQVGFYYNVEGGHELVLSNGWVYCVKVSDAKSWQESTRDAAQYLRSNQLCGGHRKILDKGNVSLPLPPSQAWCMCVHTHVSFPAGPEAFCLCFPSWRIALSVRLTQAPVGNRNLFSLSQSLVFSWLVSLNLKANLFCVGKNSMQLLEMSSQVQELQDIPRCISFWYGAVSGGGGGGE